MNEDRPVYFSLSELFFLIDRLDYLSADLTTWSLQSEANRLHQRMLERCLWKLRAAHRTYSAEDEILKGAK